MAHPPIDADVLRSIPLFRNLTSEQLRGLANLCSGVEGTKDAVLFGEGDPADELYLLVGGEVVLSQEGEETYHLRPPAIIGEVGAMVGRPRTSRAVLGETAMLYKISAWDLRAWINDEPQVALRVHENLLAILAEKIHRDQKRLADMRGNLIRTQKAMKRMRDLVEEHEDSPVSAELHDTLEGLIRQNRRVNYRVEPPAALPATVRLDGDRRAPVVQLSRTHVRFRAADQVPRAGEHITGVLWLSGPELPVSGRVLRVIEDRVDVELDLFIDEYADILEGYLTRCHMLDFLV